MLNSTPPIDRPSLHSGTRYLIAPRVPHGLASVVEGLTREILRHHPEDIYVFAAHHFEKLLKLREQYHAEEYSGREFDHEFGYEFKLWPTKKIKDIGRSSNSDWSLEKKIEIFESRGKMPAEVEESTDVSTDRENRKTSKQTCSKNLSITTKKTSKKSKDNETTSDIRATRIISQMSALHGKNIQTKDIKQELRRNKLSGEKVKTIDTEKGIRNERRCKMKISKTNKDPEEEIERATTTTTSSSRTSARRPLRKVRRIETESETETEREMMTKTGRENGYERSNNKNNGASNETIAGTRSKENRSKTLFSEHSSERKVSSRALSMDRIRAYVLRKFASTASLEVLRSPTYVEQVQEVIDRAAPIIKEKLEEVRVSRGKRSRSVDLAWNKDSFRQRIRDGKKDRDYEKEEKSKRKTRNELPEREIDIIKKEETENSFLGDKMISNVEIEEKKSRRRSVGSGKKTRRCENGDHSDVGVIDQVDNKHIDKLEHESDTTHILEAKLTATQNILEDISKSSYDLGGIRKNDSAGSELLESEISDHANIVSLPIVRPPSSRNSRSAIKNGLDSLTLPPISPEVPKSMKKKDELSLPILPVMTNSDNHSTRKSQDGEESSTMHDITNDTEDEAIISKDNYEEVIVDAKQNPDSDLISSLASDIRFNDAEKREKDKNMDALLENNPEHFTEKRGSLEEFEELERKKMEEIFKDSLNVTPEVNVSPRPDSLEPNEEKRFQNNDVDFAQVNTFEELKDKLIQIEIAERNIEIALAGQLTMHGEEMSQVEKSMIDRKINDLEKSMIDRKINDLEKSTNEVEEIMSEVEESANAVKISMNKNDERKKRDEEEKNVNEIVKVKDVIEISMNQKENLSNKTEKSKTKKKIERSSNEIEDMTNEAKTSVNESKKSTNKTKILKNEVEKTTNDMEILIKATKEAIKVSEDEKSMDKTEKLNEKLPIDVEKLTVKIHIEDVQSINPKSQNKNDQITQVAICEADDDNVMTSKNKTDNTVNKFSKITICGNLANKSEISTINLSDENTKMKEQKKLEIDTLPAATSLSLELPFSYVLSEGSPCEIPDSVTTVIIPDRHYPSPVTLEDENYQLRSMSQKEESFIRSDIIKKRETHENEHSMEIFGEYIRPEISVLPIDIDFMRGTRGIKSNQIVIAHQDLDRIKEEGEEEEKKGAEKEKIESPREQKDDKQPVIYEKVMKLAILEENVEHEEHETTSAKMTFKSKDVEEISEVPEYKSLPDTVELIADNDLTDEENINLMIEFQNAIENSSEDNGSTQDTRTITSSDVKESTASNRSIESPSLDRPIVPELNLDSLQDNTISSFKMTVNGTMTKEDNDSPRDSDTTTSLIEPLISDERLNQQTLANPEKNVTVKELAESLSRHLQSEIPEADQLYRAEHAEYEWLEKDLLSWETNLEDELKSQENNMVLPEDVVLIDPLLRDEEMENKLKNEEEIAKELISSLEEDMQLYAKELVLEEKSKNTREPETSSVNDKSNRSSSESVDKQEKKENKISLGEMQTVDKDAKTEVINELSSQMMVIKQDHKDKNTAIDNKPEEIKLEMKEKKCVKIRHVAPLAQFEQDELLELNDTQTAEKDENKIIVESKFDVIDMISTNNKENLKDKQTSVEEVTENQSNENTDKIEELHEQQKENEENIKGRTIEKDEEKITVESKLDINDMVSTNNQENFEDKQISVEEITESQSNESTNKIEELYEQQKESEKNIKDRTIEKDEENIAVKSKLNIIDMISTNNQENLEEKQTSIEEVIESQNNESTNKIEELHEQQESKESKEDIKDRTIEKDEEKITFESKLDSIDIVSINNQKNFEDKQTSVEEITENQSNESINKIEGQHGQQKISEKNIQDKEECEQERLKIKEKREQKRLEVHKECQREKSEKYTKEDRKIQEKDDYKNLQLQEKNVDMKTVPLEAKELRKGLMNESTNDDDENGKTNDKLITCDEFVTENRKRIEKDVKNNEIEKHEDLLTKIENVHKPIASVISEQSTENHFCSRYWITETKSSTVETVIETSDFNSNINERIEPAADVPEIIKDELLIQKTNDFYLAVVKIQACFRGFLTRRRMKEDVNSKPLSDNVSSAQKTDTNNHLTMPLSSSLREARTGRQRLRREEALRNTTLSLENAFATGRLQHTGEFHDSVPLPLFDSIYYKANSTTDEFLNKTIQEDVEQINQSNTTKFNANTSDSVHDDEHKEIKEESFQKGNVFTDHSTFPIVMHLLADASCNRRFTVSQNFHSDFDTNTGETKPKEPTLTDILMLGYPRDDENRYLNFITSVEDLGSNIDFLSLDDTIKYSKNANDAHPLTTSGEDSLREPLALPGTPQNIVIEEVTSLDAEFVPLKSATKLSTASKTSLDTNSSVPSEEYTLEDEKKDLGTSPRIMEEMGDRKHMDERIERQKSDCNLESIPENDSHNEDVKKESSEVSCDNHERVEEEKNEKM
ncbi:interaptin-like isoform X2 [Cataglyphis hispanica]|uniref:interaptin-like isoform X2 n=1 Tax=Cataglyphis hispanica TaxID=1086592 RepID=UPI0021803914|nr:interaptin-like isoform X2 [Cataglyphis hispanica]